MDSIDIPPWEHLRRQFEGREAIYVEKGVSHVRIRNIRAHPDQYPPMIEALVEEIPTPGFEHRLGAAAFEAFTEKLGCKVSVPPISWTISSCHISGFSQNTWLSGNGGWRIYFASWVVQGVRRFIAGLPESVDRIERYNLIVGWLMDHQADEETQPVFPRARERYKEDE